MKSGRTLLAFNSLLLFACLLDFLTTRYALNHDYQEANPWVPLGFNSMALTTLAIFATGSVLFYFSVQLLARLDEPVSKDRTMTCLLRALNKSPIIGIAFGLAPLPPVIAALKLMAGVDNLLLVMLGSNFGSTLKQYFATMSIGEFFIAKMVCLGTGLYVIVYTWMLARWLKRGSLL